MSLFMRGKSCELRILQESDEEARIWERGVMGNVTLKYMLTGSVPMRWIDVKQYWQEKRKSGSVHFGIWIPGINADPDVAFRESRFVGVTGLYDPYEVYRCYEFRIMIFDSEQVGKGIGQEATWLCTDYAFRRLNAHRVWLGVHEDNEGAIKCYEKCGYKWEGKLRDAIFAYGKYSAAQRYAMLRGDWEQECLRRKIEPVGVYP